MNTNKLSLLLSFVLSCAGQEQAHWPSQSYLNLSLEQFTVSAPQEKSFAEKYAKLKDAISQRNTKLMSCITALCINSIGDRLVIGFKDNAMVLLDNKKNCATVFELPGRVHSLHLDPTDSFITVASGSDLFNVSCTENKFYALLFAQRRPDFFGITTDPKKLRQLLTGDLFDQKQTDQEQTVSSDKTCAFKSSGKYIAFHRRKGFLVVEPNVLSGSEAIVSTEKEAYEGCDFDFRVTNGDVRVKKARQLGNLVAVHNDDGISAVSDGTRVDAYKDGKRTKFIFLVSKISSLMAMKGRPRSYLVGTSTGQVHHCDSEKDQVEEIIMIGKPNDRKPFDVLTCNAQGTIVAGSIGDQLYFGSLPTKK